MERLNGKVALITGAGKGIGKAIAIAYAKQGIKVYCIARTLTDIDLTVNEIKNLGGDATAILCDVTNYKNLEITIQKAFNQFGHIDILVINAGTDCEKLPVDKLDIEEWKRVIDVNLNGAFYTAKAAIPYIKRSGAGKIITIGSGMGHKGRFDSAPYSCSKAGLWMLTRILAQELLKYNISVNELIPGPVNTDMGNDSKKDNHSVFSISEEWIKEPNDVVDLAIFLARQPDIGPTAQSFSLMRRDI
ncbi:SDR family oxidoreductase [Clostridium sp. SHJSY1]|uniref:SDR family NAD(P)-dependent oxidoreductase n=1 Tax=Clostridium sp. SHJSY1 TaxID=2942483 RepID=UPI002875B3BD|nr:SDR family oxidoreductase [Clostridium sp. SHJSY1]MDS0526498.1 SDR family oxidoreductase [Clostridium sp. SHJSY1]